MVLTHWRGPGFPKLCHMDHLPRDQRERRYGTGTFAPVQPLQVAAYTTITFTFEIGESGVAPGGHLGVGWRWPFDWHDLQTDEAAGDGFMSVELVTRSSDVRAVPTYHRMGGVEPWHHVVAVAIEGGSLGAGDRVRLVCGDRSGGGRGWRAPTCTSPATGFVMMIDPDGAREHGAIRWLRLPDPPDFRLEPGPPERLVAVAPSQAAAGVETSLLLRAEDRWGNPARLAFPGDGRDGAEPATLRLRCLDLGTGQEAPACELAPRAPVAADTRSRRYRVRFRCTGRYELTVELGGPGRRGGTFLARSNPVFVTERLPQLGLYWGDLHAGQTATGCGTGSAAEHYAYARHVAGIHFASEQSNDHYVTKEAWHRLRADAEDPCEPGAFVTFLGCEWSPDTPAGGDRNVFYRRDEPRLRRSSRYFQEAEPDPEPDVPTAPEFHRAFRGEDVLVNLHVGGRMTNLEWFDGSIERLCEIHSTHGTVEWFVEDALDRGYRVGITAGTDGVMGRPGADHPGWGLIRNVPNGLTAVYAEELTREALWQALRERRCYATSGERIVLWVDVDGRPMGSEYQTTGHPTVSLQVTGTAGIREVDLFRGTTPVARWNLGAAAPVREGERWIELLWSGTRRRGSAQAQRLRWDGSLRITGGTLLEAIPVGFYGPDDTLAIEDEGRLRWVSATAGNEAGARLRVRGDADTAARFETEPCSFAFRLAQVAASAMTVDAGDVDRRVRVGPAPALDGARDVRLTFTDTEPLDGTFPYWVRVTQVDRAKAWSTPVYVTRSMTASGSGWPLTANFWGE